MPATMDRWRGLTRRISRRTLLARGAGLAAGITFGGVLSGAQARPNPARVFNHVNVIAMDRPGVLWDQAVLVADGLVRAVAPAMARIPEVIVSIPADGRFLMPASPICICISPPPQICSSCWRTG